MENQQSGYESYVKEAGMVPAFHSKAVSHGKNVQATNSWAGTVYSRHPRVSDTAVAATKHLLDGSAYFVGRVLRY
jgi:hypothetical protein